MKEQRLSRKLVHGIVFVAVVMLSSSLWADTILLQFLPPGGLGLGATITVTPGEEPTQVHTGDFEASIFLNPSPAWSIAGRPENGFLYFADINQLVYDRFPGPGGSTYERGAYIIGFTAPGSNVILDSIVVDFIANDELSFFFYQLQVGGSGGTCDQFDIVPGETQTTAGECFAYADGAVHDLGLFTGVDNLEIQTPTPDAAPVPEPSSFLLLGTGLVSGAARLRRKLALKN